ncbi:MAG: alpha/beta fold hydrolase [Solirubrobacteraceae bacterium]
MNGISSAKGFSRDLEDREAPLCLDMAGDSRTLLLAFGGMVGKIGIPPFEFFSLTAGTVVKRLFVRDLRQAWYHRGIPRHGSTLAEVAQSLRKMLEHHQVERLVVAGCSAGGYAALVFGTLLGAHTVICFAPQTVLDLDVLAAMDDHRWDERLGRHAAAGVVDGRFTDMRELLPRARCADTAYRIYFADSLHADRLHAERLAGLDGVRLYRFGTAGHNIARSLRDSGSLRCVLDRALSAPAGSHSAAKFGHRPTSISG